MTADEKMKLIDRLAALPECWQDWVYNQLADDIACAEKVFKRETDTGKKSIFC